MLSEDFQVQCPYCFESQWLGVDTSLAEDQSYVEDCQVCCRPMQILVRVDESGDSGPSYVVEARHENDA